MSENMIIKDEINSISNKFRKLAEESFDKEKILYEKICGDDLPSNVEGLYKQIDKIYSLIDNFLDTNNFLMALRNNNFYNALVTEIIQDENSGAEKAVEEDKIHTFIQDKIKETAQRRDNKDLQRTTANTIYSVIYHLIKDKDAGVSYQDIIKNFNITFLSVSTEENIENNNSSVGEITIRQRMKTQDGKRGLVLWNKQDTSNLIKTIEDKYKNIKISKKGGDLYILTPQQLNSLSPNNTLIDIFVNTIKAKFSTEKGIGEMIRWIEENKFKINTRFGREQKLQELLTGQKTLEQVKGDIGELIVNLILGMILESDGIYDEEKKFLGSQFGKKSLGTGQMAVDLALKNIGFQVKNFPSSEWKDSVTLYEQQNVLYTDNEIYYDKTDGNRYMNNKNWKKIALYGMNKAIKEDIINILVDALPNYLRYSENIRGNKQLEALTQLKNNFYIINFRIIPASIIFLELSEFLKKEASDKISKMFYYTLKKTSDSNNENNIENNINKELEPNPDLFKPGHTVLFAFKGINLFKPKDLNNIKKNLVNFGGKVNG